MHNKNLKMLNINIYNPIYTFYYIKIPKGLNRMASSKVDDRDFTIVNKV